MTKQVEAERRRRGESEREEPGIRATVLVPDDGPAPERQRGRDTIDWIMGRVE